MCASSLVWHSQWHLTEGPCYQRAVKVISHRRCHVFFFFLSLFLTLRHKDFTELRCCGLLSLWLFLFPQQPKKVLDSQNTALNEFLCILSFWIEHFYQGDFFFLLSSGELRTGPEKKNRSTAELAKHHGWCASQLNRSLFSQLTTAVFVYRSVVMTTSMPVWSQWRKLRENTY